MSGGHLIEDCAERKQVGAGIEFLGARLFRRHVRHCAERAPGTGELVGGNTLRGKGLDHSWGSGSHFGETEIQNLRVAARIDEKICGLDVAMHDAFRVRGVERIRDVDRDGQHRIELHRPIADDVLKRFAFQVFHGDERLAAVLADIVDGANIRVIERGSRLGSRWKRISAWGSLATASGKNFSATKRFRRASSAL